MKRLFVEFMFTHFHIFIVRTLRLYLEGYRHVFFFGSLIFDLIKHLISCVDVVFLRKFLQVVAANKSVRIEDQYFLAHCLERRAFELRFERLNWEFDAINLLIRSEGVDQTILRFQLNYLK